jgi:hypothetical protein
MTTRAAPIVASLDPSIVLTVRARRPLRYAEGAAAAEDRPSHVRAASAVVSLAGRLAIVQDDALFVALAAEDGAISAVALPRGEGGHRLFDELRGNKEHKLDLEAAAVLDGRMIAFGSGSTPARERLVVLEPDGAVKVIDAPALYAGLRECTAFSGSELNVEGAVLFGDRLLVASRGNGAPRERLLPVDAICTLDASRLRAYLAEPATHPPPQPTVVRQYDLGVVGPARLTFTDLARDESVSGERVLYVACAESSPDAVRDGPVSGVAIGVLSEGGARYGLVRDENGALLTDKIEGFVRRPDGSIVAVVDVDDPLRPAELLELTATGL